MSQSPNQRWSIRRIGLAAWLAALLVLSGQIRAEATPAGSALTALEAATVFCQAGPDADHGKPVLPHTVHEAAVLHASLAATHPAAIAAAGPAVPAPPVMRRLQASLPQARAPPGRPVASAYARGPPRPV